MRGLVPVASGSIGAAFRSGCRRSSRRWIRPIFRALLTCCIAVATCRPTRAGETPRDYLAVKPQDMRWWREARFGVFICWGPVTLTGKEIGWSRGGERRGRKGRGPTPVEVYDNLYKRWNPTAFDAREWIEVVKASGAKYVIFLTKHHDGFCLFDSQLTDYKITSPLSPFRRDVTAEIAEACHEAGIRIFWYYSQPDWHHPDYRTPRHDQYVRYLHGQVRELLTRYGRIDGLWFDGLGGRAEDWDAPALFKLARTLQPHILINNRCGLPGDFDTPEQRVGRFNNRRPWESCITLGTQWAWKPNDRIKSLAQCISLLVRCAGGDGNLALNIAPMPDGRIEPRQAQRLREMASQSTAVTGAWCLAIVDIDNLSVTNERLGRRVGDALLFRIADIIQTTSDTLPGSIVGRWGGEEFAILMPRTSLLQGRQLAEEIRGAVNLAKWECRASAQPVVVTTTVSVGVVQHRNGESATELLARALECVARAKRRGRNCVVSEA